MRTTVFIRKKSKQFKSAKLPFIFTKINLKHNSIQPLLHGKKTPFLNAL